MNIYFLGMLISMILYIVLGVIISNKVKNANDFFVAGRQAPTILIVGSLVASYCSTGLFMGDVGEAYGRFYVPFIITVIMQTSGYILGSVFFGKYLRRSEALTIPEFFGKRFHSRRIRILAAITAIFTMTVYLLSVMQGIGTLMNYVTGIDYNLCIFLALITFTILTFLAGSKGVLITDTIMFGIFTIASLVAIVVMINKLGGWYHAVESVTKMNPVLFSWHGDLNHLYGSGIENMVWALITGLTWVSVCAIGPWQSSRYLMAKSEHVVVRSSVWAAIGVGLLEFFIPTTAVLLNIHSSNIDSPSHAMIWAAMNLIPTLLGVVMLTGVLAAGISSATTFLSLVGSAVANDICHIEDEKKLHIGRISIIGVSIVVMALAFFNPPQIYVVLLLSGTVVTCAWLPVCITSIWSKKVTEAGAFWGMLLGFSVCAITKILASIFDFSFPVYTDPFFLGLAANILGLIVGSKMTKVSTEEKIQLDKLMIVPEKEKSIIEIQKTKKHVFVFIGYGVAMMIIMICFWVIPYWYFCR